MSPTKRALGTNWWGRGNVCHGQQVGDDAAAAAAAVRTSVLLKEENVSE